MSAGNYTELSAHIGHNLECVEYGAALPEVTMNVAIECVDCAEVLVDYELPDGVVVTELPRDGRIPCPRADCDGHIVEIDVGCRINDLQTQEVDTGGDVEVLVYSYTGDSDFETDKFVCSNCNRIAHMPDDFEIEDWS